MPTSIVNLKNGDKYDVYVGRPTKWGNPFRMIPGFAAGGKYEDGRAKALRSYRLWMLMPSQADLRETVRKELRGKVLACYCKPLECHGDLLAIIADSDSDEELARSLT